MGTEKWHEAEKIQRQMGRRILGLRKNSNNEVVYGELGWWRLKTRRDLLRLRFWRKIINMKETRLTKIVYEWERKRDKPRSWCRYTRDLLSALGLGQVWTSQAIEYSPSELSKIILEKLQVQEQYWWKQQIDSKPRLRTYLVVKESFCLESYLKSDNGSGRRLLAWIQSGANPLRIESGRAKGIPRGDCKCWFGCDQVEDEYHFLVSCHIYADLRQGIIDEVGAPEFGISGLGIMMGTGTPKRTELAMVFIQRAINRRTLLLSQME